MKVVKVSDEAFELGKATHREYSVVVRERWAEHQSQYPIELGMLVKVVYDVKTDRYVAHFGIGKALQLKTANAVAAFLAEHKQKHGEWRGVMEDGVLTDVALLQP